MSHTQHDIYLEQQKELAEEQSIPDSMQGMLDAANGMLEAFGHEPIKLKEHETMTEHTPGSWEWVIENGTEKYMNGDYCFGFVFTVKRMWGP